MTTQTAKSAILEQVKNPQVKGAETPRWGLSGTPTKAHAADRESYQSIVLNTIKSVLTRGRV